MPIVNVNGIHLNYRSEGTGTPVVMLTGFGGTLDFWNNVSDRLSTSHRIITVDNRGVGGTICDYDFTMRDIGDDIIALLDHLNIMEAHFVGWSMGSHVAQDLAIRYPDRVLTLTVMSSYRRRPSRSMYLLNDAVQAVEEGASMEHLARTINGLCYTESFFERMESTAENIRLPALNRIEGLRAQLNAVDGYDTTLSASSIRCPTLSIHGVDDIMVECKEGDALYDLIPNCEKLRIVNAGHLINPDLYIERLVEHLKKR